jgi:hypothetical protein
LNQADKKRDRERKLLLLTLTMVGTLGAVVALSALFTRETFFRLRPAGDPHNLAELIPVVAALVATMVVMITAIPMLTRQEKTQSSNNASSTPDREVEAGTSPLLIDGTSPTPFEVRQLAGYYSQTLSQSRISFWFSLIFAAIGFMIIVGGAALYTDGGLTASAIKISSGIVIDGVSALFFVQSRRSQEAMSTFFEKLRNDRQFVEARAICNEISDNRSKDHLKTILVLHYSGLDAKSVIESLPDRIAWHDRSNSRPKE